MQGENGVQKYIWNKAGIYFFWDTISYLLPFFLDLYTKKLFFLFLKTR